MTCVNIVICRFCKFEVWQAARGCSRRYISVNCSCSRWECCLSGPQRSSQPSTCARNSAAVHVPGGGALLGERRRRPQIRARAAGTPSGSTAAGWTPCTQRPGAWRTLAELGEVLHVANCVHLHLTPSIGQMMVFRSKPVAIYLSQRPWCHHWGQILLSHGLGQGDDVIACFSNTVS
jgi:hypothetical protein